MAARVGGKIQLVVNGRIYSAKGNFTYNLGLGKREPVIGADRPHGYKETPQVSFIEGEITDRGDIDTRELVTMTGAMVTLEHGNGKVFAWRDAYYAADGTGNTDEGNLQFRFESEQEGEEVPA